MKENIHQQKQALNCNRENFISSRCHSNDEKEKKVHKQAGRENGKAIKMIGLM